LAGNTDGVGTAALFNNRIAMDTSGNVFVADNNTHEIRLINPNPTVITLAGGSTSLKHDKHRIGLHQLWHQWSRNGRASQQPFRRRLGQRGRGEIRLIYPNRTVITLAARLATTSAPFTLLPRPG
jgi:hypothetical protein